MAACETQTFTGITQQRFDCLVQKAAAAGIVISGNQGQASQDGITMRWNFDSEKQTIELQCLESPWYAPCATVNSKIHDLVNACP